MQAKIRENEKGDRANLIFTLNFYNFAYSHFRLFA